MCEQMYVHCTKYAIVYVHNIYMYISAVKLSTVDGTTWYVLEASIHSPTDFPTKIIINAMLSPTSNSVRVGGGVRLLIQGLDMLLLLFIRLPLTSPVGTIST